MNPRILNLHIKAHQEWIKEQDYLSWLQGRYIYEGFSVALSHFASKNSTLKYLEHPYMESAADIERKTNRANEEQKKKQAENYMLRLQIMASNWNRNNKDGDKSGSVS